MKSRPWLWGMLAFLIVALLGGAYCVIYAQWPLEVYLRLQLQKSAPWFNVQSLSVGAHQFTPDYGIIIADLKAEGQWQEEDVALRIQKVTTSSLGRVLKKNPQLALKLEKVDFKSKSFEALEGSLDVSYATPNTRLWQINTDAVFSKLSLGNEPLGRITFALDVNPSMLRAYNIYAGIYNGQLNGEFVLEFEPELIYDMDIHFDGIDTRFLPAKASGLTRQLKGVIKGDLKIKSSGSKILMLDAKINAPKGARVNAKTLQFFVNYVPASTQKKRLEELIKQGNDIFLDRFVLDIVNEDNNRIKSAFDLKSEEFNLDLKLNVDVNVDAGLVELFQSALTFSSKENL